MIWRGFGIGLFVGFIFAGAAGLWLDHKPPPEALRDQSIAFSDKIYFDTAETSLGDSTVTISGSVVGDNVSSNNTTTIKCQKAQMRCDIANAAQIGADQVDEITLGAYEVRQWTPGLIVAVDDELCVTSTLSIERRSHEVSYATVPNMEWISSPACKGTGLKVQRLRVDRSAFWRRLAKPGEKSPTG